LKLKYYFDLNYFHLNIFEPEGTPTGRVSKGREGRVLRKAHVYRHHLGPPEDHELTFSKFEMPCEDRQDCFRISQRH